MANFSKPIKLRYAKTVQFVRDDSGEWTNDNVPDLLIDAAAWLMDRPQVDVRAITLEGSSPERCSSLTLTVEGWPK